MRSFVFFWLLFGVGSLMAQQNSADSLLQILEGDLPDTQRILVLTDLAFALYGSQPDAALEAAGEAIALSEEVAYERGLMKGYYSRAAALLSQGNYEEALEACEQALYWANRLQYSDGMRAVYNLEGVIYRQWGKPEQALEPLFTLLKLSEADGFLLDAGLAAQNIASIYTDMQEGETAKEYLFLAERYFSRDSAEQFLPGVYLNLSSVVDSAEEKLAYLHRALASGPSSAERIYINHNLASVYRWELFLPDSAMYFFEQALGAFEEVDDAYEYLSLLIDFGSFLADQGQHHRAERLLTEALSLSEEMGQRRLEMHAREELSRVYSRTDRMAEAYEELYRAFALGDSLFTESLKQALAEADARYENEKRRLELVQKDLALEREHNLRMKMLFLFFLFFALVVFGAYFYSSAQKAKKKAAELQVRLEKEEAERLRKLHELKSRFFSNIVHEYRTPLTLILGPLEDLMRKSRDSALKSDLRVVEEQAQRLLHLTDEVLALARLEEGEIPVRVHPCLFPETLKRMVMAYVSAARLKGVSWSFSWDGPTSLLVRTDEDKLEVVLNSLLENALKFTEAGGSVEVQAFYSDSVLKFSVYNEGEGILPEDLPHVFERFYRGKHDKRGSGLGLAFAKELCEMMGGEIEVESQFGRYARFRVKWPVEVLEVDLKDLSSVSERSWEADLSAGCKAVVLLVEDDPEMTRYLLRLLGDEGYHVLHAREGRAALDILEKRDVDLIISDVSMPGMGGFAFRQMLLQEEKWRVIPFVFLTARAEEEDRIRGFRYGVDDYLVKPFSARELRARLRALLERREWRKAVEPAALTAEQQFVAELERLALEHLSDPSFGVEELAARANYSRRQLSRLVKEATGLSPVQFLLEVRLQRAYQLLKARRFRTVSEVRYEVGIESASYFSRKFAERFGIKPSELYARNEAV